MGVEVVLGSWQEALLPGLQGVDAQRLVKAVLAVWDCPPCCLQVRTLLKGFQPRVGPSSGHPAQGWPGAAVAIAAVPEMHPAEAAFSDLLLLSLMHASLLSNLIDYSATPSYIHLLEALMSALSVPLHPTCSV